MKKLFQSLSNGQIAAIGILLVQWLAAWYLGFETYNARISQRFANIGVNLDQTGRMVLYSFFITALTILAWVGMERLYMLIRELVRPSTRSQVKRLPSGQIWIGCDAMAKIERHYM